MDDTSEEVVSTFFESEDSLERKLVGVCLEAEDVQFITDTSQSFLELCSFGEKDNKTENANIEYR